MVSNVRWDGRKCLTLRESMINGGLKQHKKCHRLKGVILKDSLLKMQGIYVSELNKITDKFMEYEKK
jgi:hypothetical protein